MTDHLNQESQQGKKKATNGHRFGHQARDHLQNRLPLWFDIITIANILVFTWFMYSLVVVIVLCWWALHAEQSTGAG